MSEAMTDDERARALMEYIKHELFIMAHGDWLPSTQGSHYEDADYFYPKRECGIRDRCKSMLRRCELIGRQEESASLATRARNIVESVDGLILHPDKSVRETLIPVIAQALHEERRRVLGEVINEANRRAGSTPPIEHLAAMALFALADWCEYKQQAREEVDHE